MGDLYQKVSKVPNYVRRFGPVDGLRLLAKIERRLPPRANQVCAIRVPGYPNELALRPQTSDHATFWQCLVRFQYDISGFPQASRLMETYRDLLRRGVRPLIVDCGANVGLASVWFATSFPEALIYAIEPDEHNVGLLRRNTATFGDRVQILKGAVWSEAGMVRITNPGAGSAAFRVDDCDATSETSIRAYSIDEICALAGNAEPFIVKIDIEGAQGRLFSANTDWVGRTSLIALELDDWQLPWQGTSRNFFSCVSRYPFDYLIRGETLFCFADHLAR